MGFKKAIARLASSGLKVTRWPGRVEPDPVFEAGREDVDRVNDVDNMKPPLPEGEASRLAALRRYDILDTEAEEAFDNLTHLASQICQTPIALVSLIDADRQWIKSTVGLTLSETARDVAFCAYAILQPDLLVVPDALADKRFAKNPLVTSDPCIRFYAGAPLITAEGEALGTLCVLDRVPRDLTEVQRAALQILSRQVMTHLEIRRQVATLMSANRELAREIAERKRSEAALKESEEWLRAILNATRDGIVVEDDGVIVFINQAHIQLLEYDAPEELIGKNISDVLPEDEARRMTAYGKQRLRGEHPPTSYSFKAKKRDGTLIEVEASVSTSVIGGKPYIMTAVRDITERKETERALQDSEQRYRVLSEGIAHQVWMAQPDGKVDYVNQRTLDYFGCAESEILEDGWQRLVHPDDLPACLERWTRSLQSGNPYHMEFRLRRADGTYRWHSGGAIAGRNAEGEVDKWYGTNSDVHDQKLAEEALKKSEEHLRQTQKLESIGLLAGGIAHDFNNLLVVINGYTDLALRELKQNQALHAKIEEVRKAGERAATLTRQLLAFSRKQVMKPEVLDLNTVVADTSKMLQRLIGENIELSLNLKPALEKIKADPGQIEQVIINLAVNARDAMPRGGKLIIETNNVELSEEYTLQRAVVLPGHYVRLAVSDTGTGMDRQTQERIFEPFFTTKALGRGTGLGLSTVYGIVKQSGGYVWVYSEMGQGTTFKIYLPRIQGQVTTRSLSAVSAELPRGTETVLLVEDEVAVRKMTRVVLERCGYNVIEVASGNEAKTACLHHEGDIHLLLTDVVMPQMGGREVAEMLLQLHPEMKVLYISGYTDDAIIHHGMLEKGTAFLEKPFMPEALARKVRAVLDEPSEA